MKKLNNQSKIILGLFIITALAACGKSFLDKPPIGTLSPIIVSSEDGIQGLLVGAYSLVDGEGASGDGFASGASNWIFGGVTSDDAYKGSDPTDVADAAPMEKWGSSLTPTNGAIPQKWNLNFAAIQRCNDVINTVKISTSLTDAKKTLLVAQARFLRAYYHMDLKKIFGNIPFVDETINPTNTAVSNTVDAWPKINDDLKFAADNLPETWSEIGRANKWAAKSMQAKALMFQKNLPAAYTILKEVIASGKTSKGDKYDLNTNYYSNFNPAQKNSKESVFAAQTSVQDGSSVAWGGDPNGNYGDILNFPYNGGPGACCGFYNPSQDLADAFKTDANGLPFTDTYQVGNHVSSQYGTAYVGNLDPRIDWTMGRPGIPYLDWGPHPGVDWIRNPQNDGVFSPLKNVYAASQKGAYTDVGSAYWGPTELVANNVNIIRFSNVLLWAAECAADAGDLPGALAYVNRVRNRMTNAAGWVYKASAYNADAAQYATQTTPADTYKIGLYTSFADKATAVKAIQLETRLELGMEGHRFFDLVRWGIAASTINTFIAREVNRPLKKGAVFIAGTHEMMPIPQNEIDNMNADGTIRLTQNKGY
ncbi:MAG: RagB/SusD family nutrient uptake outer membrane protein [Bacteroidetes bacterium]|nr:RagB/SusD family nutrient uptake outer membrane protein [Bacteroidota bacterium]